MGKKQDNGDWAQLNDMSKHITGKVKSTSIIKIFLTTFFSLIMIISLTISIFFIALTMESAFNSGSFKTKNIEVESIIVDMNNVPIVTSDKNLRLPYFEEETKKQVFALVAKESWWSSFFSTNISDYEFTYYKTNSDELLDKNSVQTDGFTKFDLKIKVKSSFIQFKIPVIVWIKNTDKFYEKFMMFNQFEGKFSKHISGKVPNGEEPEQWYHGYLPNTFYYPNKTDNTVVYKTIQSAIQRFTTDYHQEFADNTKLFPIISTIVLPDIDFNDVTTIKPYYKLIKNPDLFYVGNANSGDANQYVNLYSKSVITTILPKPFFITYVSNPNIVYDLIEKAPKNVNDLIAYLKDNPIDFAPFSMVQIAEDDTDTLLSYSPEHTLLAADIKGKHFQYQELTHYFGFANSITNNVETINSNTYVNIGALEQFLTDKYWNEMYLFAKKNPNFFSLHYPDPTIDPDDNWKNVIESLAIFKGYFKQALNVTTELTSFSFLDISGEELSLNKDDIINTNKIKKIRFHVGTNLLTSDFVPKPHSFNFIFKINWT